MEGDGGYGLDHFQTIHHQVHLGHQIQMWKMSLSFPCWGTHGEGQQGFEEQQEQMRKRRIRGYKLYHQF